MRQRLTYANVISTIALFVALGGGAYAAVTLQKGDVTSKHVADNTLKSNDLKDGKAVKSQDVKDGSLRGADILDGSVTGADVASETLGSGNVLDESLTGADVENGSLTGIDIANGSIGSADVLDDGLTGDDIDESSLDDSGFEGRIKAAMVFDDGTIVSQFNSINSGSFTVQANNDGEDIINAPFPVAGRIGVVGAGTIAFSGGQAVVCFQNLHFDGTSSFRVQSRQHDGNTCNEEWSILIF